MNLASRFSDKIILLQNGRVFAAGEPEAVITQENIRSVYGVNASITNNSGNPYIIPITPV